MATREITQLQDRFTGDVNKIRDEKIATASDASGASDMTSQCEFLIKNGQTGEFMNFLKSYIDESVRNALGALVNNLDKGTSIKSVLATDADNDLGSITPANLASVLSAPLKVLKRGLDDYGNNLNDYRTAGIYDIYSTGLQNAPYSVSQTDTFQFTLCVFGGSGGWFSHQLLANNKGDIYSRFYSKFSGSTWTEWKKLN